MSGVATPNVRPTFINIGPGRCATSWLLQALSSHPDVEMASVKETEYFNTHFGRSVDWYEAHFRHEAIAVGEISSNYYLDEAVAARLRNYNEDLQLLINLRNPFTLLESFYKFGLRRGLKLNPLEKSMDIPIGLLMGSGYAARNRNGQLTQSDQVTLLDSVCLLDRLSPFLDSFPAEQIHFFIFEQLQRNFESALYDLYTFLGVDPRFVPEGADHIVNSSVAPKSVLLARLATQSASTLRRIGMHRILSKLHQSEFIKRVLFRDKPTESQWKSVRQSLDANAARKIDDQMLRMIERYPVLARFWQ